MHSEMCPTNLEVLARIGTAEEPRVPTLTSDAFFFFFSETPGNKRLLQRLLQDCQPAVCEGASPELCLTCVPDVK